MARELAVAEEVEKEADWEATMVGVTAVEEAEKGGMAARAVQAEGTAVVAAMVGCWAVALEVARVMVAVTHPEVEVGG